VGVRVTTLSTMLSLSWGLVPYSDHQLKGAVFPEVPRLGTLRLQSSILS